MGRSVYTGIYEPGHPTADADGFRADVGGLVRDLGVPDPALPGRQLRLRVHVGGRHRSARPAPDPARPGLAFDRDQPGRGRRVHQLVAHGGQRADDGGQPRHARRGRGAQPGRVLQPSVRHPMVGSAPAERCRRSARHQAVVPRQRGRRAVADRAQDGRQEYARLAAETAKAMRRVDPTIELVACGSSHSRMPTFGTWEATVLAEAYDVVDYLSLHSYYEQRGDDRGSFLASGVNLDRFIDATIATCDYARAVGRHKKKINLSVDEWNVWYQSRFGGEESLDWTWAPRLIEDTYSVVDAVVVGSLLITLLRHADRVRIALPGPAGQRDRADPQRAGRPGLAAVDLPPVRADIPVRARHGAARRAGRAHVRHALARRGADGRRDRRPGRGEPARSRCSRSTATRPSRSRSTSTCGRGPAWPAASTSRCSTRTRTRRTRRPSRTGSRRPLRAS